MAKRWPPVLILRLFLLFVGVACVQGEQDSSTAALATSSLHGPTLLNPAVARVSKEIQQFRFNAPLSKDKHDETGDRIADDQVKLELSPLAIAVTLDGGVHAVNRETGQWLWSLHSETGAEHSSAEEPAARPLISVRKGNASIALQPSSSGQQIHGNHSNDSYEDEEVYVIEPHSQGYIYLWRRNGERVQRLPLSIVELVERSPFTFPGDDARMFVGRKMSSLIGVDLRSGRLVGDFGPEAGWCEWHDSVTGKASTWTEAECEESIERRPGDLLYLGKTGMSLFKLAVFHR
jgi:serine/threonine-protein kinase/endoribonuclease IRE1